MTVAVEAVVHKGIQKRITVSEKELKTCVKCGEHYFGEHCVGCHSNQYAHYNADISMKHKILITFSFLIILGLILLKR